MKSGKKAKEIEDNRDNIIRLYDEGYSVLKISQKLNLSRSSLITFLKKEGIDTKANSQSGRTKTMIEKYGAAHILQTKEGQKKIKETFKKKYGSENPFENQQFKKQWQEKSKKTCLDKYGTEYVLCDPNRQEEFVNKRKKSRPPLISKDELLKLNIAESTFYERVRKWGFDLAVSKEKKHSYLEIKLKEWLSSTCFKYQHQFPVKNYIADFYIDNKVIVECDGLYFHSEKFVDRKYHLNKRQAYLDNGYIPLFFRSDEINKKFNIVKSIILNKLNKSNILYARKLNIVELNKSQAKLFFSENHLMGNGRGNTFALVDNDNILSALQIVRVKDKNYEISRFCNKLNFSVVGGLSRLISYFEKQSNPTSLKTFIDQRYGFGNYLEDLGFVFENCSISFKWTNGKFSVHRMKYPGSSGYDYGLFKIYDCGQSKWCKYY